MFHHQPWLLSVVGHIGILAQVKADKDSIEALVQPVETADRLFQEIQRLIRTQLKVFFNGEKTLFFSFLSNCHNWKNLIPTILCYWRIDS